MEQQFVIEEDQIVTNNSFLSNVSGRAQEIPFEPIVPHETIFSNHTQDVAYSTSELFPNYSVTEPPELKKVLNDVLSNLDEDGRSTLRQKLKGHFGAYEDNKQWIDLQAAWLLDLHPDLSKPNEPRPLPNQPALQSGIKLALSEGRYIPMQHILHALHLAQFNPQIEEYPLSFTQVVPIGFVEKINRSDVLRGINIHALFLGVNFPLLAVQFATIIEKVWEFMFKKRYSALAGMELYNEYFFDFSCKLGRCIVAPLDHIPQVLEEKVIAKYKPG